MAAGSLAERRDAHQHSAVVYAGVTNPARDGPRKYASPRPAGTDSAAVAKVVISDVGVPVAFLSLASSSNLSSLTRLDKGAAHL